MSHSTPQGTLLVHANGELIKGDSPDNTLKVKGERDWLFESFAPDVFFDAEGTSLADINGIPGVAYRSTSGGDLRYAKRVAGVWSDELVFAAPTQENVLSTTLVEMASGHPGIAYFFQVFNGTFTFQELRFSEFNGATWTHTTIVSNDPNIGLINRASGEFCAIINGEPAVIYERGQPAPPSTTQTNIYYARAPGWAEETAVAVALQFNTPGSLAQVGADAAIAYGRNEAGIGKCLYAERTGGAWPEELVNQQTIPSGASSAFPGGLVEIGGEPHISLYHAVGQGMRHVERIATVWTPTQLVTGNSGQGNDIVEYLGRPHILYTGNGPSIIEQVFDPVSGWSGAGVGVSAGSGHVSTAVVGGVMPVSTVLGFVARSTFGWLFEGCCC